MADNLLELLFKADTHDLDEAKEKLQDLGKEFPTVGQGLENLAKAFLNIPGPVGIAIAAMTGFAFGLHEMVDKTIEAETRLLELSEAIGVPIEKLQPFMQAMELAGISGERLQVTMGKLATTVSTALSEPTGKAADAFKKLGISQEELAKGDVEQIMKDAAKGFDQYADSAAKTAAVREIFGKQGPMMIAAMKSEEEMEIKAKEAQEAYGTVITEADGKSAKYFGETLKLGMSMFDGIGISITHNLLPGLQELVNQFAESGKQGGFMRDMLDGLNTTISIVSKSIITLLVEPIRNLVNIFHIVGNSIGGIAAGISEALQGHFAKAHEIFARTGEDAVKMAHDSYDAMAVFENSLWNGTKAVKEHGEEVHKGTEEFKVFDPNVQKVSDSIAQLAAKLSAQTTMWVASKKGLEEYKAVQDELAISTELLKLRKQGATEAILTQSEALMRATNAAKVGTTEELSGQNALLSLKSQLLQLTTRQTELNKAEALIERDNLDKENKGLADEIRAKATLIDQKRQEADFTKIVNTLNAQAESLERNKIESLKLSNKELQLKAQFDQLHAQYVKDTENKEPAEVAKITEAYKKQEQAIKDVHAATEQEKNSFQGFKDGAMKGLADMTEEAHNYNKIGGETMTKLTDGLTNSFMNMGKGAKAAFEEALVGMLQYFEQLAIKAAMVEAITVTLEAFGWTGAEIGAVMAAGANIKGNANGNAFAGGQVTAFAMGGVVDQPTMAPMALFGEAGPEAIMPLQRDGTGRLGVKVNGDTSSGQSITNHNNFITVNSSADPHETAKQVRRQLDIHTNISKATIAQQTRTGGMLSNSSHAFG